MGVVVGDASGDQCDPGTGFHQSQGGGEFVAVHADVAVRARLARDLLEEVEVAAPAAHAHEVEIERRGEVGLVGPHEGGSTRATMMSSSRAMAAVAPVLLWVGVLVIPA
ncbi:hypothetical protein ACWDKQ_11015 [Saccharopolyspora sp. NPDC000995]